MNVITIDQAIARAAELKTTLESIDIARKRAKQQHLQTRAPKFNDVVFNFVVRTDNAQGRSEHGLILPVDVAVEALDKAERLYKAELSRLQAVIDMANAALKGMES